MAIFDAIDTGRATQNVGPTSGQVDRSLLVEGRRTISWSGGGKAQVKSQIVNVKAPFPIGGAAADSKQAVTYVVQQLVELSHNPDRQPIYIQWDSGDGVLTPNPWDGWWRLDDAQPLDWTWQRHVPCQITATLVALGAPNLVALAHIGGPMSTDYSGGVANLLTLRGVGGTDFGWGGQNTYARFGAEGGLNDSRGTLPNPYPFTQSLTISDILKGGVRIYDTISTGANPVPVSGVKNYLSQPGFETSTDWIVGGIGTGLATIDNTNPHSGTWALKATNPSAGNYGTSFNKRGIWVRGAPKITVTAWLKSGAGSAATGPVRITFANPGALVGGDGIASAQPSAQAGVVVVDNNPSVTTSYQQFSWTIDVPAGYSWAFIEFYSNGSGAATPVYLDDITIQPSFVDMGWVEVFDTEHDFVGDCVITNGLQLWLLVIGANKVLEHYLWTPQAAGSPTGAAPQWVFTASLQYLDNGGIGSTLRSYVPRKIAWDEVALEILNGVQSTGQAAAAVLRMQAGRYEGRARFKPRTQATTSVNRLMWSAPATSKITYNPGKAIDTTLEGVGGFGLAVQTDYGYSAIFIASAAYNFILGFLSQNKPGTSQGWSNGNANFGIGDGTSAPIDSETEYGFFATPYGVVGTYSPVDLQHEMETGTLSGGFVSAADAGSSGGNVAKLPNGTAAGAAAEQASYKTFAAGTYDIWARVRVTSNASGTAQLRLGLRDATSGWVAGGYTDYAPNAFTTGYLWYRVATAYAPSSAHVHSFRAEGGPNAAATDFWVDEMAAVPKTLSDDERGPQDIWQHFGYDRSVEMVLG